MGHGFNGDDLALSVQTHDADALGGAAVHVDVCDLHADDHAVVLFIFFVKLDKYTKIYTSYIYIIKVRDISI